MIFERVPTGPREVIRHLGPGLIITASIVGSGELIVTPKLGAAEGFTLLWFIVVGCLLKVFVQIELARFAVSTGRTTLDGLNLLPGPRWRVSWLLWLWLGMYVGLVFQVAGIAGGIGGVLEQAGLGGSDRLWAVVAGVSSALLLATGRYGRVEHLSTAMVAAFTLATVVCVGSLAWTPYAVTGADLAAGLSFGLPASFTVAFAAFGIIGVGASELIYYPYWCLEKGYGRAIGPFDGSAAWTARARGWMRVMRADAWTSFVIYTLVTVAFYVLGAAVLHRRGLAVTNDALVPTLSQMYLETFGVWSRTVFLTGAFFVLYSTLFVATASNARLFADAGQLFGLFRLRDDEARARVVRGASVGLSLLAVAVYLAVGQPVTLVLVGAIGQALLLPFLGLAAVYFRHRVVVTALRPGTWTTAALWVSAAAMCALGVFQLWQAL